MTSTHAARRAVAVALVCAALLVAAWIWPPLAIAVVWPLLFVVPGAVAVGILAPRLAAPGRVGLAIVISVALSTHVVYWLAMAIGPSVGGHGYGRPTIFAAAALLAASLPLAAARGAHPSPRRAWRALRRHVPAFAVATLSAAFVGIVLSQGLWHVTPSGVAAGGSNWSDLPVHLSIAESLNAGNFPPQVPYFAGEPLVYHWFADFHAAIAAKAADLFSIPAFVTGSAVGAAALALCVHGLASHLLRGRGARRAAVLAAVLVVFGGGLAWTRLLDDVVRGGDLVHLVTHNSYDNIWYDSQGLVSWPYFRIPSVMGTGLLVHRATAVGLPIMVGAILLLTLALPIRRRLRRGMRDRPYLLVAAGLLGAALAPFQFFLFPALIMLALGWVLLGGRLTGRGSARNAARYLLPFVIAVPFALPALTQAGSSGALQVVAGWESAPRDDGLAAVAFFYLTNLGIPFALALAGLAVARVPYAPFLAAWVIVLFAVPNLVQVSVVAFDMNKLFQAMAVGGALAGAWLVRRWPRPVIAGLLVLSIPSPLLVGIWSASANLQMLTGAELDAAGWARTTPERSVFVTDGWLTALTDPAGRLRLTTFDPYVANLGYRPDARHALVDAIFCDGDATASATIMRSLGARYVVDAVRPQTCPAPVDFSTSGAFREAYANDQLRVWELTEPDGPAGIIGP